MNAFHKSAVGYRIEVSGWGLDHNFFVESTELHWTPSGDKELQLHRALAEGTVVFVRLLHQESSTHSVPVPYRVEGIEPMDRSGCCQMKLRQVHRRSKESLSQEGASNELKEALSGRAREQEDEFMQTEEVLQ